MDGGSASGDGRLADTVLVSNRGPLAFHMEDGKPVAGEAGGWPGRVAVAHGRRYRVPPGWPPPWERRTGRRRPKGSWSADGLRIELVEPDPDVYNLAYNVVSNAALWFCHHHLFDAARRPRNDRHWGEAWDAYRELNQQFAARVAKVAPEGGRVLVQDYHLALIGSELAAMRPDLRTVHFTHTPFADPSVLRMLPTATTAELLDGMAGFDACGFHTARWAAGVPSRPGRSSVPSPRAGAGPARRPRPSSRRSRPTPTGSASRWTRRRRWPPGARSTSSSATTTAWSSPGSTGWSSRRTCCGGSGPSTSSSSPIAVCGAGCPFLAMAYPTRQGLAEYVGYRNEVESTVARINERWATTEWTPIVLEVEDDYPRSLAALTRSDVLMVNPVRDGLNLVAKEGPLVNRRDGVLAPVPRGGRLRGARARLRSSSTRSTSRARPAALARALAMEPDERAQRAATLRRLITARRPADWLARPAARRWLSRRTRPYRRRPDDRRPDVTAVQQAGSEPDRPATAGDRVPRSGPSTVRSAASTTSGGVSARRRRLRRVAIPRSAASSASAAKAGRSPVSSPR